MKRVLTSTTILYLLTLCLLGAVPGSAFSQQPPTGDDQLSDPEVSVVLEGRQRSRFRLAMPAVEREGALGPQVREAADLLEETLRTDLDQSGVFDVQGPVQLSVLTLTGADERDFELYRSLRNELLLRALVKQDQGRLILEGRVYDLASGKVVLGKRYRGDPSIARRIAHTFADEIILYFSGRQGLALTSIAFASDRSGFKEIYLMDADGANQRPITAHKSISMSPEWNPNGRELAYISYYSGSPGIYLVDLTSGRKTPVITSGSLNISPSFSPDGKRIAFARSIGDGNSEIFVCNRDGSGMQQLTHSSGIDTNPAWSPSGREIAFTSSRTGSPQIYIMDAEGANLRRVTFDGNYNDGAAWSPDGTRIVYASRRTGDFDVAVADVVTLESRLLTNGGGSNETPSFSPDGRRIIYTLKRTTRGGTTTQIFAMDASSGNPEQLTTEGNNSAPVWSGFKE